MDAFPSTVCPDTVSAVADAVERVVWPDTERVPVAVRLVVERLEVEALERDDCPETERVPCEDRDEVAMIVPEVNAPLVREEMVEVRAVRVEAKKEVEVLLVVERLATDVEAEVKVPVTVRSVEVALVNVASVAVRVVMNAVVAERREEKKVEEVALVKVASVAKRLVAVALVMTPFVP